MKKIIFLILCIISVNTFAQQKDTLAYYTDLDLKPVSKQKAKITFKLFQNNPTTWTFLKYNSKNVIELKETYFDSLLTIKHGQYVVYRSGKPSLKGLYFNNLKHGNYISYDEFGKVEGITNYNLDTLKTDVIYWQNGDKREVKTYGAKNQVAERLVYYENGNLAIKQVYAADNKVIEGSYLDIEGKPVKIVEIEAPPIYPGGVEKFYEYIARSLRYPTDAMQSKIQGSVLISYVISETGEVVDVKVDRGVSASLDREAVRVMLASPKWTPAKLFGKNVRVKFTIPIKFSITG